MLFDSPDLSLFQNFPTDLDVGPNMSIEGWRLAPRSLQGDWDQFDSLQTRVANVMNSETALMPGVTTSLSQDDPFISHGKYSSTAAEEEEGGEVVVVGKRKAGYEIVWDGGGTGGETTGGDGGAGDGGGGGTEPAEPQPDEASITSRST